jgi:Zn-dependent M28 family amino/carboxypeptidase
VTPGELESIDTDLALGSPRGQWVTRNSYNLTAKFLDWLIRDQLNPLNIANVSRFNFRADMYDNVIAEIPGSTYPNEIIFLGSHLDSRTINNTSPTEVAPGADDNGSGSAVSLLFARLLQRTGLRPSRTIRIGWFSGEEQGLLGSRALAQYYRNSKGEKGEAVDIRAMFNVDMVGWFPTTAGYRTTVAFMIRSASLELTNSCRQIISVYTPTPTGETTGCCSDQQSFHENGFPALGVFETPSGNEGYPHYHRSTDLPQYVNFTQVALFAQAIYSCVLTAAL